MDKIQSKDGGSPEEWASAYCDLLEAAKDCDYLPCIDFACWVLSLSANSIAELEEIREAWERAQPLGDNYEYRKGFADGCNAVQVYVQTYGE